MRGLDRESYYEPLAPASNGSNAKDSGPHESAGVD